MEPGSFFPRDMFDSEKQQKEERIVGYLHGLPTLVLSDTGVKNVCNRFQITVEDLQQLILKAQQSRSWWST